MRIRGETSKQNFDALIALVGLQTVSLNLNPTVLFLLQKYKIIINNFQPEKVSLSIGWKNAPLKRDRFSFFPEEKKEVFPHPCFVAETTRIPSKVSHGFGQPLGP